MRSVARSKGLGFVCSVAALAMLVVPARAQTALEKGDAAGVVRTPVLVELFTSEGCSSCPPADALLARLLREQPVADAEIIVLEEHVDYWDELGWHDRFSAHQFTERQSEYAQRLRLDSDYTPQMIVDGTDQFVGNDSGHALRAIAQAARMPKAGLAVSGVMVTGGRVSGAVTSAGGQAPAKTDLIAVLVEEMASTSVLRGENGGRTLRHVSVVRAMQRIGGTDALARGPVNFSLGVPAGSAGDLRVIVFAQRPELGAVVGAASAAAGGAAAVQMSLK